MRIAKGRHRAKLVTLQRDMLEELDRVGLQAVEWVAALEADTP